MAVAQERVPQSFQRAAELQRETRGYSRVPGVRFALASWLVRLKEDFADRAVSVSADRGRIALAGDFKIEAFAGAAVFESLPHGCTVPPSKRNLVVQIPAGRAHHGKRGKSRRCLGCPNARTPNHGHAQSRSPPGPVPRKPFASLLAHDF